MRQTMKERETDRALDYGWRKGKRLTGHADWLILNQRSRIHHVGNIYQNLSFYRQKH